MDKEQSASRPALRIHGQYRLQDGIMGSSLASVKPGYALSSHGHLILRVIAPLLRNEVVTGYLSPLSLNLSHVFKVCQTPAMIMQERINEEEAKVIDLRVTGIRHPMLV